VLDYILIELADRRLQAGALVKEETRELGRVSLGVYLAYVKFAGVTATVFTMVAMLVGASLLFYTQYWIGLWGAAPPEEQVETIWLKVESPSPSSSIHPPSAKADIFP
jgi:hypothetical protein